MIITDIAILKHYVGLNTEDDIEVMSAHIAEAQEEYLETYLGLSLTQKLDTYVESDKLPNDPVLDKLLKKVERPLAYFAYMIATPFLDVVLTQSGFAVVSNSNLAPASKDRVANLKTAITDLAHKSIERLLLFLEQNITNYPEWQSSDAYFEWNQFFINTANRFNKICNIDSSRLRFLSMRQDMADVEQLQIEPAITNELATEIKQQAQSNTLTPANKIIFELIQRAAAHLTFAANTSEAKHEQLGNTYLSRTVNIILNNPNNYPAAATLYESKRKKRTSLYQNNPDTGFYVS